MQATLTRDFVCGAVRVPKGTVVDLRINNIHTAEVMVDDYDGIIYIPVFLLWRYFAGHTKPEPLAKMPLK